MRKLLLIPLLTIAAAATRPTQAQVLPALTGTTSGVTQGVGTPPAGTDTTFATVADMTAATGLAVGTRIGVTENGYAYDVVDESAMGSHKTIDTYSVLVFDEDRASVTGEGPYATWGGTTLANDDLIFGTVTVRSGQIVVPDSLLAGTPNNWGASGSAEPQSAYVLHDAGSLYDFRSDVDQCLESTITLPDGTTLAGASSFTVDYEHATSTRRIVKRDHAEWIVREMGGEPCAAFPCSGDDVDNAPLLNWAARWAKEHPLAKVVNVDTGADGRPFGFLNRVAVLRNGITLKGRPKGDGNEWDLQALGGDRVMEHRGLYDTGTDTLAVTTLAECLNIEDTSLDSEAYYTGSTIEDVWAHGNARSNTGVWDGSVLYDIPDIGQRFRNSGDNVLLNFGWGGGKPAPAAVGRPYAVTYRGNNRFEETHGHTVQVGSYGRYWMDFEPGATITLGSPGNWLSQVHTTYFFDMRASGAPDVFTSTGYSSDIMVDCGRFDVGHFRYVDPAPEPFANYEAHNIIDCRSATDYATLRIDSLDVDVRGSNHKAFIANGVGPKGLSVGHGDIYTDAYLPLLQGSVKGPYSGVFGPAAGDSLTVHTTSTEATPALSDAAIRDSLVLRGLRRSGPAHASNNTEQLVSVEPWSGGVSTLIVDDVAMEDQWGNLLDLFRNDDAPGFDLVIRGGSAFETQKLAYVVDGFTHDAAYDERLRFILTGGSTVPAITTGGNATEEQTAQTADLAVRAWDVTDSFGNTAEETGSVAGLGSGSAITINTDLLWAAREIEFSGLSDDSGALTVTDTTVYASDCTTAYARPISAGQNFRDPCIVATLDRAISGTLSGTYTARVTPLAHRTLARPRPVSGFALPSVTVGQQVSVDLDTMFVHEDYSGNPGALAMTYEATTVDTTISLSMAGSVLTYAGDYQGPASLRITARDEAGTATLQRTATVAVPETIPDPTLISGLTGLYSVSEPDGLLDNGGQPFVPAEGDEVFGMNDLSESGCDFTYENNGYNPPPTLALEHTFEVQGKAATNDAGAELVTSCTFSDGSGTIVALYRYAGDGAREALLASDAIGGNGNPTFGVGGFDDQGAVWVGGNLRRSGTDELIPSSRNVLQTSVFDAASQQMRLDGGAVSLTGTDETGGNTDTMSLFAPRYRQGWDGGLVALAIYDRVLTAQEIADVEGWALAQGGAPSVSE